MANSPNPSVDFIQLNFVCLGNICRSPLAHTLMETMIREAGLSHSLVVDSSGMGSWHVGNPSDARMRKTASHHGFTITHRARQFSHRDGETFHHIYAMDSSVYESILTILPEHLHTRVKLFRYLDPQAPNSDVPDPYYGGDRGFEEVFSIVSENCALILHDLSTTYKLLSSK